MLMRMLLSFVLGDSCPSTATLEDLWPVCGLVRKNGTRQGGHKESVLFLYCCQPSGKSADPVQIPSSTVTKDRGVLRAGVEGGLRSVFANWLCPKDK